MAMAAERTLNDWLDEVARAVRGARFMYASEDELQQGLEAVLRSRELAPIREVRLNARDRIDLVLPVRVRLVDGTEDAFERWIGLEVKVAGTRDRALAQLTRYAQDRRIAGLVLVTSRFSHAMPGRVAGKPLRAVSVLGGAL